MDDFKDLVYIFAMVINLIRFIANVFMARFLRSCRVRFLYFISIGLTAPCLGALGLLQHPSNILQLQENTSYNLRSVRSFLSDGLY